MLMGLSDPQLLFGLLVFIPVAILAFRFYRKSGNISRTLHEKQKSRWWHMGVLAAQLLALGSIVVMLAGPHKSSRAEEFVYGDYILLVDVSKSMAARLSLDAPSRLKIAQGIMSEVVSKVPQARYQVFAYSRLAFPLTPLTSATADLQDVIKDGIFIEVVPVSGSNLPGALSAIAREKLATDTYDNLNNVIVFSDGGLPESATETYLLEAIERLREANISLLTVGIGSKTGERIPILDKSGNPTGEYEEFLGSQHIVYLGEEKLRQIARSTGGEYFSQNDRTGLVNAVKGNLSRQPSGRADATTLKEESLGWLFILSLFFSLGFLLFLRSE